MTLESIEKLLSDDASLAILEKRLLSCTGRSFIGDALNAIAEEIEAEIAERYMELPVDADGVPIHLGDELDNINKSERYKVTSIGDNGYIRIYSDTGWIHSSQCRHVKPRTVEDVLRDVWKEALDYAKSDMWRNPDEVFAERAAEIRDLMEVER